MVQDFIVSFYLRNDEHDVEAYGGPFIPLRIQAENADKALQQFAARAEGTIVNQGRLVDGQVMEASVTVDSRLYRVLIASA